MEITIREFESSDKDSLVNLMGIFNQYVQSVDDLHRTAYKEGSSEYFTDKMIKLTEDKEGIIYIACDKYKIIGFISGHVDEQDEDEKMEAVPAKPGVVEELYVNEEYRGQKVGKRLLEKMEIYLKSKGCDLVRLAVFAPNTLARNFYKHTGYHERIVYLSKDLTNR